MGKETPANLQMNKSISYPRGSEWRRWDLHVHTPASALNSSFQNWDSYIDAVEKTGSGVSVLGVTDYCTVEGYKRVLEYRKRGRLQGFSLVLPNIEFRITPELPGGGAINIHLLISPDDPEHVQKIEQALRKLTFVWKGNPYACIRDELTALGRSHKQAITDEEASFRNGVNIFKPSFDTLRDWYNAHSWLKDNSLVVVSNGKDGASGLSKDSGFSACRDELYRFSHLIFSANPSDREYFLGQGSDNLEKLIEEKGSAKACVHGSDAHNDAKLFAPDLNRFCWVKADPTFEGLRQIVHEPADRVYIGPTAPGISDRSKVIDSIAIRGGDAWFETASIPFNSGLVAIIGEKGSGKTALADVISYVCRAWDGENSNSSFIWKARHYLDGIEVTVNWADGHTTEASLASEPLDGIAEVRYLSQDFVEQLCSQDFKGEKLVAEVESVVFSHIDEAERLGASSFAELRRETTAHLEKRRADIRSRILRTNAEIVRVENEIALRPSKVEQIKKLDEAVTAIDKQLPELQPGVDAQIAEQLRGEREALQLKNQKLVSINKRRNQIVALRSQFDDFYDGIAEQFKELRSALIDVGVGDAEIEKFRPVPRVDPRTFLDGLSKSLELEVVGLRGIQDAPVQNGATIADISARIKTLESKIAADQKVRERLLELQNQRQKADADRQRLSKEIERIDNVLLKQLTEKRSERIESYMACFDVLSQERTQLEKLYKPLGEVISGDTSGTTSGFNLNVRQIADYQAWLDSGADLLDKRRKGAAVTNRDFGKQLEKTLFVGWQSSDRKKITEGLKAVIAALGSEGPELDKLLVSHATRAKLYDWLFSPAHVRLQYSLSYQGTDLDALSPGTRGIVLLVLYLAMDRTDRRPLLIDQPEGNLDNSSIYDALVPFLRHAKKHRQVFLVTHNPNLVVTTDAEQIIVASGEKAAGSEHAKIRYEMGALEQAGNTQAIRDQAVRLLEGGKKPFKIREGRWAIS